MSTGTIIVIVIAAVIVLAILAFVMPRMRARRQERQLNKARGRPRRATARSPTSAWSARASPRPGQA